MSSYIPTVWEDEPSTVTPINATRLNNMEAGIVLGTQAASEVQAGNVELASAAELTAGTDLVRAVSPKRLADYITARLAALPGASAATESAAGIVELASAGEMTTGTDLTRVPSVKRVADYVTAQIAASGGAVAASETVAGIVELATAAELTAGTDLTRATSAKRVADYVTSAVSALAASVTASLAGKADVSGSISQFADVSNATPADQAVLAYDVDINAYDPVDLSDQYAPLGADARLATTAEPRFFVGTLVLNEGAAIPSDTPPSTIIFRRAVTASITPVLLGQNTANAAVTVAVTTTQQVEVGEYVLIGWWASGEAPTPTTFPSVTIGGGTGAIGTVESYTTQQGSTNQSGILFAKCTTTIPVGRTITVTVDDSRAEMGITVAKSSGLASTAVKDQNGSGTAGASTAVSAVTAGATGQAQELGLFVAAFTNTVDTQRTIAGTNGWTQIGATQNGHGANDRSGAFFYKELAAVATITATATISNGTAGNGGWAATIVTLKAA